MLIEFLDIFKASPRDKKQEGPRPLEPAREHPLYYDWGRQTPASQVAAGGAHAFDDKENLRFQVAAGDARGDGGGEWARDALKFEAALPTRPVRLDRSRRLGWLQA